MTHTHTHTHTHTIDHYDTITITIATLISTGAVFGPAASSSPDAKGELLILSPSDGCAETWETSVSGRIVLLDRGNCNFIDKAKNAVKHGAIAVIIANVIEENNVFLLGGDGTGTNPSS